jgi:hypothetical protein
VPIDDDIYGTSHFANLIPSKSARGGPFVVRISTLGVKRCKPTPTAGLNKTIF